ncbi:unnamed protein product, partial [Meganyctiphanes norvegica]
DCLSRQKYVSKQDGTHSYIRAWANETDQSSSIIRILLEFEPEGHPETYDIIEIWKDQIEIRRVRKNIHKTPQKLMLAHSLTTGWIEMILVSGEKFVFKFPKIQNSSYTCEGEKNTLKQITVEGSNISVNCIKDMIYWKIDDTPNIIPLQLNMYNEFSIFSRKNYTPSIKIGEKYLQLGYNDGIMNDISPFKDHLQIPLPGHIEHFVSIGCINNNCKALLGKRTMVKAINVPSSSTMSVSGRHGDSFFLILHLELVDAQTTVAPTPIEIPTDNTSSAVIIVLAIALVAMVVLVLVFILLKLKREEFRKSPSHDYRTEEYPPLIIEPTLTHHSSLSYFTPM